MKTIWIKIIFHCKFCYKLIVKLFKLQYQIKNLLNKTKIEICKKKIKIFFEEFHFIIFKNANYSFIKQFRKFRHQIEKFEKIVIRFKFQSIRNFQHYLEFSNFSKFLFYSKFSFQIFNLFANFIHIFANSINFFTIFMKISNMSKIWFYSKFI